MNAATAPERAAEYHASAGFSSTLAREIIRRTPAHAKARVDEGFKTSKAMDLGTAVHQLLLRDDRVDVIPFDEWRTNEAKALVAASREAGRIPMKPKEWDQAQQIADAVRNRIADLNLDPVPFTEGTAEHVIRWTERGVDCRAMLDWLRDDVEYVDDLKTTNDASPRGFRSKVWKLRYDIQAAFYLRAVAAWLGDMSHPIKPRFRWVAVETEYPYLVTVHELDKHALENADARRHRQLARLSARGQRGRAGAMGSRRVGHR
jgi:exodeoxyribonuclease VIII